MHFQEQVGQPPNPGLVRREPLNVPIRSEPFKVTRVTYHKGGQELIQKDLPFVPYQQNSSHNLVSENPPKVQHYQNSYNSQQQIPSQNY